jgi:hypothetical protein
MTVSSRSPKRHYPWELGLVLCRLGLLQRKVSGARRVRVQRRNGNGREIAIAPSPAKQGSFYPPERC